MFRSCCWCCVGRDRRGMTLIELLVVILIMAILLGITLPVLRTTTEGRRIREAARELNTGVAVAKGMAAEVGRPAGLILDVESLPEDPRRLFARRVFFAEAPPPYIGDLVDAIARVRKEPAQSGRFFADFSNTDSATLRVIAKSGDTFRFQNREYTINQVVDPANSAEAFPGSAFTLVVNSDDHEPVIPHARMWRPDLTFAPYPASDSKCRPTDTTNGFHYIATGTASSSTGSSEPSWPTSVGATVDENQITWQCVLPFVDGPYQVLRAPEQSPDKSGAMPTELPDGVVIDIEASGFGLNGRLVPAWHENRGYPYPGYYVQPKNRNGYWYVVEKDGISGANEPAWPTTVGVTVDDGVAPNTVRWRCELPFPITVTFAPSGRVLAPATQMNQFGEFLGMQIGLRSFPVRSLHLLIGSLDKLGDENLQDPSNRWISINPRTGQVTTTENGGGPADFSLATAREFAQSGRAMGGR